MSKATAPEIDPEDFLLAPLSPEQRLDAALRVAKEAFKGSKLSMTDVEAALAKVRRKRIPQPYCHSGRGTPPSDGRHRRFVLEECPNSFALGSGSEEDIQTYLRKLSDDHACT
jgi:hypothetical protein